MWKHAAIGTAVFTLALPVTTAQAAVIGGFNVLDTFNFIDARQSNSAGLGTGTRISFGLDVTPVGTQPPMLTDGTRVTANQGGSSFTVPYINSPALPNQFFTSISYPSNSALTGSWTLQLSNPSVNGGTIATVSTPALATTIPPPFVNNVLLTPNGQTPTISWTRPSGYTPSNQSVYVFDRTNRTPSGSATLVYTTNIGATANSFTLPAGTLAAGTQYTFSVQLDQRAAGGLTARSRSFVDFNQAVTVPAYLPVVQTATNVLGQTVPQFVFNFGVTAGLPVTIDPDVAVGFEYQIGAGDPLFSSVTLPDIGDPTGYQVCPWTGTAYANCTRLGANQRFTFANGISRFEVVDIDASLGLDPSNPTAFPTTLTFASDGQFTGTMTALLAAGATSVPEPVSTSLLASGLVALGWVHRRGTDGSRKQEKLSKR